MTPDLIDKELDALFKLPDEFPNMPQKIIEKIETAYIALRWARDNGGRQPPSFYLRRELLIIEMMREDQEQGLL